MTDLNKQVAELKAQVNLLLKACQMYGDDLERPFNLDEADTIVLMTPEQCLNSVKADAIDDALSLILSISDGDMCFDVLTERVNELRATK